MRFSIRQGVGGHMSQFWVQLCHPYSTRSTKEPKCHRHW